MTQPKLSQLNNEPLFRDMVDRIPQMIWVSGPDGYHEYYNARWYEFTGVAPGTTDGTDKSWNGVFHPDDAERARPKWLEAQATGRPYDIEYRLRRADGVYRWVLSRAVPIFDARGVILKWYGTCTDIQELVEAREKAQAANKAKSEYLAHTSHEIRTPMNAILGLGSILRKTATNEAQKKYLDTLISASESLLTLINDTLDVAKIENSAIALDKQAFSLRTMMENIIGMMSVKANEKNLTLTLDCSHLEKDIYLGDAARIQQVVVNLVGNAIKFTAEGKVSVELSDRGADDMGQNTLCVRVKDTGIGIASDKLALIFEQYAQSDASITREYGGTGLGLAISKNLVEQMGGLITVNSAPGKGSTFTVCIPLEEEMPAAPAPVSEAALDKSVKSATPLQKKVLLVEDYEANILVATTLLEDFGCTYDLASNGVEALERIKQSRYDVILMDIQMHGMDGYEATKHIRQWEIEQNLSRQRIIAMTAHALFGDREQCISAGMDDYLSKPFNADELRRKIEEYA